MKVGGPTAAALRVLDQPLEQLPGVLELPAPRGAGRAFAASIRPPGSKSLTNRAVVLAALAEGRSVLRGALLDADDAEVMLDSVQRLGAGVERGADGSVAVTGVGGRWRVPAGGVRLDVHNAGTAARFLAGAALLSPGPIIIDGNARLRQRPMGELGGLLGALGCGVEYLGEAGRAPVRIVPPPAGFRPPANVDVSTTQSSQFISAVLLAGPWLRGGITLRLLGEVTSAAYISMTLGLLARLGASVRSSDDLRVLRVLGGGGVPAFTHDIEPDASGATYWWAAGAMLTGATVLVEGLGADSLQGDAQFPELLARMGARVIRRDGPLAATGVVGPTSLRPVLADMGDMPDAAMTLASAACFADGASILRGLRTLRVKECDRIEAVRTELGRLGVRVESPVQGDPDAITITPPPGGVDCSPGVAPVEFQTYDDHRMAMSLALIGLRRPGVRVAAPACVGKTYPGFWRDFGALLRRSK